MYLTATKSTKANLEAFAMQKDFFFLFCNNIKELSFTKSLGNSKEQQDFPSFRMSLKQKQPRPLE